MVRTQDHNQPTIRIDSPDTNSIAADEPQSAAMLPVPHPLADWGGSLVDIQPTEE